MIKRVVIAGSRHFDDYHFFCSKVDMCLSRIRYLHELAIIPGHCSGVDMMAERYAKENGLQLEIFPAEWNRYGRSAGPIRNRKMVDMADFVIAFTAGGNGTKSLLAFAEKKGIPVKIIRVGIHE